jgi:hypothetical protein
VDDKKFQAAQPKTPRSAITETVVREEKWQTRERDKKSLQLTRLPARRSESPRIHRTPSLRSARLAPCQKPYASDHLLSRAHKNRIATPTMRKRTTSAAAVRSFERATAPGLSKSKGRAQEPLEPGCRLRREILAGSGRISGGLGLGRIGVWPRGKAAQQICLRSACVALAAQRGWE